MLYVIAAALREGHRGVCVSGCQWMGIQTTMNSKMFSGLTGGGGGAGAGTGAGISSVCCALHRAHRKPVPTPYLALAKCDRAWSKSPSWYITLQQMYGNSSAVLGWGTSSCTVPLHQPSLNWNQTTAPLVGNPWNVSCVSRASAGSAACALGGRSAH